MLSGLTFKCFHQKPFQAEIENLRLESRTSEQRSDESTEKLRKISEEKSELLEDLKNSESEISDLKIRLSEETTRSVSVEQAWAQIPGPGLKIRLRLSEETTRSGLIGRSS